MSNPITQDGVLVRVGQIWRRLGNEVAQRDQRVTDVRGAVAAHYRGIGESHRADFWDAKAGGDSSFSFENWVSKQAIRPS